jgi:uncharacterized protein (TIGR02145 family)
MDGSTYKTVKIGSQLWMAENLKTAKYANGDPIQKVAVAEMWKKLKTGAWSFYNNDKEYETKSGKLYNGYAVFDDRGLCPTGWRVPTQKDWESLIDFLGGDNKASVKLKSKMGWSSFTGDNTSGFNAFPGGNRKNNGDDVGEGVFASWWSSTPDKSDNAFDLTLSNEYKAADSKGYSLNYGFSVRCLKE